MGEEPTMAFNLVRSGTSLVVGAGSSVADSFGSTPLFGLNVGYGAFVETGALVLGGAMQAFMPMTAEHAVEGLVDGSLALLAKRTGDYLMTKSPTSFYRGTPAVNGYQNRAAMYGGVHNATPARGQTATISNLDRIFAS